MFFSRLEVEVGEQEDQAQPGDQEGSKWKAGAASSPGLFRFHPDDDVFAMRHVVEPVDGADERLRRILNLNPERGLIVVTL